MSDFERELKRAKVEAERARLQEEARKNREADEQDRTYRQRVRQLEQLREQEVDRYLAPFKSTVDRLLKDLGNATWGAGKYGFIFRKGVRVGGSGSGPEVENKNHIATWIIGRQEYFSSIGSLFGSGHVWRPITNKGKYGEEPTGCSEYFYVNLGMESPQGTFHFEGLDGITTGSSESELKEMLKRAYLEGPKKTYPHVTYDAHGLGG
ncbi:MAG: hypothetical protein A3C30_03580 [Candidatus Levybacteria bacterium RIFCSPHIGHO2_02_FULL_40_18]|nr:MAG: hypothetical protein A2869_00155 [Candidatus Levybacteria bacterium RIFCSPHIGHO2_01_FULL_40_58]OGH26166.1 MAG: hypothetical protein A3C30_03580 [Candidatus Levybacteria bacterium RIFCSPHIGHO2_02_FULL_40_18]OGH31380.1 MAG: hypothetical protein A3E43_03340 [Candidatus Levybacteria bacterium RIFCSPHIGHO2_12_FULL_40_31]OGH40049.1 MAG: hypothetical protein A2894_03895 [Candidatus Levybacteria bacterium RIFCSPLOWO2_01_FULL_40_64]OGH49013.1 MAG: hypothetical protein A3I54_00360 [Candidatus Lev